MTRTEIKLYAGAERHWPGSGQDLVAVYQAFAADRELSLWAAATISSLLQNPAARFPCLEQLRARVPTPTRRGPKMDRSEAAFTALSRLTTKAVMS